MGLDMYLTGRKYLATRWNEPAKQRKEDNHRVSAVELDLGYWRKHPNLHGFIVKTFAEGKDECQEISLDKKALEAILIAINDKNLPHTDGFFFGTSDGSERDEDFKIISAALSWLSEPHEENEYRDVYYRASW